MVEMVQSDRPDFNAKQNKENIYLDNYATFDSSHDFGDNTRIDTVDQNSLHNNQTHRLNMYMIEL